VFAPEAGIPLNCTTLLIARSSRFLSRQDCPTYAFTTYGTHALRCFSLKASTPSSFKRCSDTPP
jgi:hypothetical protein